MIHTLSISTLISNLCNKITDNGKGKSRKLIFNHKHEIYSGRTSSVVVEKYEVQNCDTYFNFIDTPGYIKYFKTTITALCKYNPNIIIY